MYVANFFQGLQLPWHQASSRRRMQDCRQHDQGQVARGDPQDIQHHQRLHTRGGGADPPGERVGWGPLSLDFDTWQGCGWICSPLSELVFFHSLGYGLDFYALINHLYQISPFPLLPITPMESSMTVSVYRQQPLGSCGWFIMVCYVCLTILILHCE